MIGPSLQASRGAHKRAVRGLHQRLDPGLTLTALALVSLGLVMVASASIGVADAQLGQPFHYLLRQGIFVLMGGIVAWGMYCTPLELWERSGAVALLGIFLLLLLVLVPGVGHTVNGATRWISLGLFNLQVSEVVKLLVPIYLAGYLVRHGEQVRRSLAGFAKPLILMGLTTLLLLAQPDFGAAVVLLAVTLGMLFLAGARLWQFALLLSGVCALMGFAIVQTPYRMARLTGFLNPWTDPFDSGFQLTQSLIAIGSGSWFGVGLGGSVQKLFYLPEAHNDFLFAVLAEELGLAGVTVVALLFAVLVWRSFAIARAAELAGRAFGAYLAWGIGIWIGLQAFINMGVNMGILPTKGLTLPLMSYGGSSMLVTLAAMGLLARVHRETRASGAALHRGET